MHPVDFEVLHTGVPVSSGNHSIFILTSAQVFECLQSRNSQYRVIRIIEVLTPIHSSYEPSPRPVAVK